MLIVVAVTVTISVVVCWRARKVVSLTFHMQRNKAYRGVATQSTATVSLEEGTISYSYPMVDSETKFNDVPILTERNKAYSPTTTTGIDDHEEPLQCFKEEDTCTTQVVTDIRNETYSAEILQAGVVGNQASIEYCYIDSVVEHFDTESLTENNAYELISTTGDDSRTVD